MSILAVRGGEIVQSVFGESTTSFETVRGDVDVAMDGVHEINQFDGMNGHSEMNGAVGKA